MSKLITMTSKTKKTVLTIVALLTLMPCMSQEEGQKKWGLQVEFGQTTLQNDDEATHDFYPSDDQGNTFAITADYYLKPRLALIGGVYFEQNGILTDYSSGIGLAKVNQMGLQAGAKFYFFPKKWIFQPHIGASIYTNFVNWDRKGNGDYRLTEGYPDNHLHVDWNVKCSPISIVPRFGFDIRLISTLSLTCGWDLRFPLGGSTEYNAHFTDGPMVGQKTFVKESLRQGVSIGIKMDFPAKAITSKTTNSLLMLLGSWISYKAGRY
jgi:hypothetical protein